MGPSEGVLDAPGELVDVAEIPYDFEAHHLGVIVDGSVAMETIRRLAGKLDRRLLTMRREEGTIWAWLGGQRAIDPAEVQYHATAVAPEEFSMATGEPAQGLVGWRLTHQQARAAWPIALRGSEPLVRYGDVALLASIFQDHLLTESLRELYLAPLKEDRAGGGVLRETMRAYFGARGNVSSAAKVLGVNRQTVTNRLRTIEQRVGRDFSGCAAELEAALRLEELAAKHPRDDHRVETGALPGRASAPIGGGDG